MHMRRHLALAAALLLAPAGCAGKKVTEIVVSIATDLRIPEELEAVDFNVARVSGTQTETLVDLPLDVKPGLGSVELPTTIGLTSSGETSRPILVTVTGVTGQGMNRKELVVRQARLPFAKDRILLLRMNLLRSCLYKKCEEGFTCEEGGKCVPIDKNPVLLPDYIESEAFRGLEAGVADGNRDGGRDLLPRDQPGTGEGVRPDAASKDGPAVETSSDTSHTDRGPGKDMALQADAGHKDSAPSQDTKVQGDLPVNLCVGGFCTVRVGTFTMGSPLGEYCRPNNPTKNPPTPDPEDEDLHSATLTHDFEMAETEVTQLEWSDAMKYQPSSHSSCADCPVEHVSWHEAAAYCNALTGTVYTKCFSCTGGGASVTCSIAAKYNTPGGYYECPGYRLPTDAEWEFAARAGTQTPLFNGLVLAQCTGSDPAADPIAWYKENTATSRPVKGKQPNAWGLHDMAGNVGEWTGDRYIAPLSQATDPWVSPTTGNDLMVVRGGRYEWSVDITRSANRTSRQKSNLDKSVGLRCVRSLTGTKP